MQIRGGDDPTSLTTGPKQHGSPPGSVLTRSAQEASGAGSRHTNVHQARRPEDEWWEGDCSKILVSYMSQYQKRPPEMRD
uniref:Uncharacterized protein n=1 Tax=Oryza meridionalis TaxID=40149 RepID=A0A0E0E963_9ORYZ